MTAPAPDESMNPAPTQPPHALQASDGAPPADTASTPTTATTPATPTIATLRVTATWNEADIVEYWLVRTGAQTLPLRRARRNRATAIALASFLTVPPILIELMGPRLFVWRDERSVATGITIAVAALAWWTAFGHIKPLTRRDQLKRARAYAAAASPDDGRTSAIDTEIAYELTPDGIAARTRAVDTHWRWSAIGDIRPVASVIEVAHTAGGVSLIPMRCFPSPDAAAEFVATARRFLAASGEGSDNHIRAHLAAHDIRCVDCGYNLRGVTTRRCPECNHEIDESVLARQS